MATSSRELAYRTLLAAERDSSRSIDDLLTEAQKNSGMDPRDKRWTMELVYGVTRMKLLLDAWIEPVFKGRFRKAQYAVKVLLRIGTFQLKFMQTAEHAAINETVNLCKKVKQVQSSRLVNAVLRKVQTFELEQALRKIKDPIQRLSIEKSHPEWLISKWHDRYEISDVATLCDHNNKSPKTWIRRNSLKVAQSDFEAYLNREEVVFQQSSILESFYELDSAAILLNTPEFWDGWFSFQDIAAGIVATIVDPQADEIVVDACAAPGGKMAYLSELSKGKASIIACDASSKRLIKVKENIERLGLKQITIQQLDARNTTLPTADKILLDVPCTGTGVLGRRPDARWKRQSDDGDSLVVIQADILKNSWESLKPGGVLVYATCSLEPEENWELIDSVLGDLAGVVLEPIEGERLKPYIDERGALATLPWSHSMDGMFAVKMRKKS